MTENKQIIPMIAEEVVIQQEQQIRKPSGEKWFDLGEFELLGKEHEGEVGLKLKVKKIKNSSFVEEFSNWIKDEKHGRWLVEVLRSEINTIKIHKEETGINDINISVGGKFKIEVKQYAPGFRVNYWLPTSLVMEWNIESEGIKGIKIQDERNEEWKRIDRYVVRLNTVF